MKVSCQPARRSNDGMAVIVVIAILSIILVYIAGNLRTLHLLRNDLRLIEQRQTNRLATAGPFTYPMPISVEANTPSGTAPK